MVERIAHPQVEAEEDNEETDKEETDNEETD